MILREFILISLENLSRMKLRTALTVSGIMIGIGALVAMLSFASGVQSNVTAEFRKLDLFRTLHIMPVSEGEAADSLNTEADSSRAEPVPLDEAALEKIADLDGVRMVYPQQTFDAQLELKGERHSTKVQALPASFFKQRPFGEIVSGRFFEADTVFEAVVSSRWLRRVEIEPDSILGETITLKAAGSSDILLGLARLQLNKFGFPPQLVGIGQEIARSILEGMQSNTLAVEVVGVAEIESGFGFRMGSVLVPIDIASDIDHLSFSDPVQLLTMLSEPPEEGWSLAVVSLVHERDYAGVKAGIEGMGFEINDFLEQFDQIRKSFLIFDVIVGAIGLLGLFIASLGIVNTMVMSIIERTREIGILKSLGARERQIRLLFLIESGTIGLLGSIAGILLGWLVSRLLSFVLKWYMARQDVPTMEMFSLPIWVIAAAIAFGVGVSVLAGLYPAGRAARVDPVRALRYE